MRLQRFNGAGLGQHKLNQARKAIALIDSTETAMQFRLYGNKRALQQMSDNRRPMLLRSSLEQATEQGHQSERFNRPWSSFSGEAVRFRRKIVIRVILTKIMITGALLHCVEK